MGVLVCDDMLGVQVVVGDLLHVGMVLGQSFAYRLLLVFRVVDQPVLDLLGAGRVVQHVVAIARHGVRRTLCQTLNDGVVGHLQEEHSVMIIDYLWHLIL